MAEPGRVPRIRRRVGRIAVRATGRGRRAETPPAALFRSPPSSRLSRNRRTEGGNHMVVRKPETAPRNILSRRERGAFLGPPRGSPGLGMAQLVQLGRKP